MHPSGVQVNFTYTGRTDLRQVGNSLGRTLTLTTTSGKITNVSDGSRSVQYGFDANSNLTSLRKRNGSSITLAYDKLNRLGSRVYPATADNVSYAYDLLGRRLSVDNLC